MTKQVVVLTRGDNKITVTKDEYERNKEFYHDKFVPDKVTQKKQSGWFDFLGGNDKSKMKRVS